MKQGNLEVTLLDHMGDDLAVVNAARVSFDKESSWDEKWDFGKKYPEYSLPSADVRLISYLAKHNHWSPFAHTSVKFRVKAPIFVARQLVKHQVGLVWNEISRRYVDTEPEFYVPPEWRGKPTGGAKQGSAGTVQEEPFAAFCELPIEYKEVMSICLDWYGDALAKGIAPEMARMVLPQSMMTEWIWTGSLLAFIRAVKQRLDPHAQLESQLIAKEIAGHLLDLFPVSTKALLDEA